jgi:hypothetical protein
MIDDYLRGRDCNESVTGSVDFELLWWFWVFALVWVFLTLLISSYLFLAILLDFAAFLVFCWLLRFSSSRWPSWDFLDFLGFLAVLHGVLDSNFKLCAFVVNGLIKEEIEKPSGQFLGLIVRSHWLGEVWIRIWDSFVLSFFYLCFIWRITFACLVVCRWQVQYDVQRWGPWQE